MVNATTVLEIRILLNSMTEKKSEELFHIFLGTSRYLFPYFSLQGYISFLLYMSLYLIITKYFLIYIPSMLHYYIANVQYMS